MGAPRPKEISYEDWKEIQALEKKAEKARKKGQLIHVSKVYKSKSAGNTLIKRNRYNDEPL